MSSILFRSCQRKNLSGLKFWYNSIYRILSDCTVLSNDGKFITTVIFLTRQKIKRNRKKMYKQNKDLYDQSDEIQK